MYDCEVFSGGSTLPLIPPLISPLIPQALDFGYMRIARRTLRTALLVAFIAFAFPQLVGLPFLSQNPVILQAALMVSRNLLFIELACAIVATVAGIILGRANQPWRKLAFGVAACVLLSRLDIYELLFHPLQTPAFISAADALRPNAAASAVGWPANSWALHASPAPAGRPAG